MYGEIGTDPRRRCGTCMRCVWEEDEESSGYMCDNPESDRHNQWVQTVDCCEQWEDFWDK
jgi:hypothetical protein